MEGLFGVGPLELMLVFFLALIFIGPGKMPEVAASLGKAIRQFQRASAELTDALNAEIAAAQAEKAAVAALVSGNGKSTEDKAEEAEVVAQADSEETTPVAYASAEESASSADPLLGNADQPFGEEVSQVEDEPQGEAVEPRLDQPVAVEDPTVAEPAAIVDPGVLYGLEPLPTALLAPSLSANGKPTVTQPAAPQAASDDRAESAESAPEDAPSAPESRAQEEIFGLEPLPSALLAPSISLVSVSLNGTPNGTPATQSPAPTVAEPESVVLAAPQAETTASAGHAEVSSSADGDPSSELVESPVEAAAPVDETARDRAAASDAVQAEV